MIAKIPFTLKDWTMATLFSYGSNSLPQLRARVLNPSLTEHPAKCHGFRRVFCSSIPRWGGAVASMARTDDPADEVYGSCVELSVQELARLDGFEGAC